MSFDYPGEVAINPVVTAAAGGHRCARSAVFPKPATPARIFEKIDRPFER
jgi:hypothetical protein